MTTESLIGGEGEAAVVALRALSWILGDDRRARRFLDLTGLSPERLRSSLDDRAALAAVLDFLVNHEADLNAAAAAIAIAPQRVVAARDALADADGEIL